MTRLRAWPGLLLVCLSCSAPHADPPTQGADALSANAAGNGTILVHYPAGWGHRITLHCGGAGHAWAAPIETTWTAGDVWRVTLGAGGGIACKPLFDDQTWAVGPNWSLAAGQTLDMWPHFFHDVGRIQQIDGWRSNILGNSRRIWIYFPPSYDENGAERFPVVYMHDGQNLFYDEDSFSNVSWNVGGAMDQGARDGSIHEALVIGIDNTASRVDEYTPVPDPQDGGGNGAAYLRFIVDELKPQMDAQLRTFGDASHTAMIGSSLGGLISLDAALTRPDVFGAVGALSPSTWWDNEWVTQATAASSGPFPARVYVDSGNAGDSNDDVTLTAALANAWKKKSGVRVDYLVQDGASHGELFWRQRVPGALRFLLGPR